MGELNKAAGEFEGQAPKLREDVAAFRQTQEARRKANSVWNRSLIIGAIAASTLVAIAGLVGAANPNTSLWPLLAALFGIVGGALVAVQNSLALGDKANFYQAVVAEAENLDSFLKFGRVGDAEFTKAREKLEVLRTHVANNVPRGQGMAGTNVRDMTREVAEVEKKNS